MPPVFKPTPDASDATASTTDQTTTQTGAEPSVDPNPTVLPADTAAEPAKSEAQTVAENDSDNVAKSDEPLELDGSKVKFERVTPGTFTDEFSGLGGSYAVDPETGERKLVSEI